MANRQISEFSNISPTAGDRLLATDDTGNVTANVLVSALRTFINTGIPTLAGSNTFVSAQTFSDDIAIDGTLIMQNARTTGSEGNVGQTIQLTETSTGPRIIGFTGGTVPSGIDLITGASNVVRINSNGINIPDGDVFLANEHGISFAATAQSAGSTSELFNDYDQGDWTPQSDSTAFAFAAGTYTKIGNIVHIFASILLASNSSFLMLRNQGLPYVPTGISTIVARDIAYPGLAVDHSNNVTGILEFRSGNIRLDTTTGTPQQGATWIISATYPTT